MYVVPEPSRDHVRTLESYMAVLRRCGNMSLNYDMWDRWGSVHASPEQRAEMERGFGAAIAERVEAVNALTALVAKLRAEAPESVAAWCDAHVAHLSSFIEECAKKPDDSHAQTGKFTAEGELAGWAEVRRGERAYVDENFYYVSRDPELYRALFGIDP
jgi:hypothetical protein